MNTFAVRSFFQGLAALATTNMSRPIGECPTIPCVPYQERIADILRRNGHGDSITFSVSGQAITVDIRGGEAITWARHLGVGGGQRRFQMYGGRAVGQFDTQTLGTLFKQALRLRHVLFDPSAAALLPQTKQFQAA